MTPDAMAVENDCSLSLVFTSRNRRDSPTVTRSEIMLLTPRDVPSALSEPPTHLSTAVTSSLYVVIAIYYPRILTTVLRYPVSLYLREPWIAVETDNGGIWREPLSAMILVTTDSG